MKVHVEVWEGDTCELGFGRENLSEDGRDTPHTIREVEVSEDFHDLLRVLHGMDDFPEHLRDILTVAFQMGEETAKKRVRDAIQPVAE